MADSPQDIIQKVVLRLEEQIQGQGDILSSIQANIKALNKAQKAIVKHSTSLKTASRMSLKTSKSFKGMASILGSGGKSVEGFSKGLLGSAKTMKVAGKAAFAMGGMIATSMAVATAGISAVIAALVAATKFIFGFAKSGEQFTRFAVATGKGSVAVYALRDSYQSLIKTSDKVLVSITDVTRTMSNFASRGFAQMQMAAESGTQQMIGSLQNAFSQTGLGKEFAAEMTSNILDAFDNNLAGLRSFQDQWNAAGNDLRAQAAVLEQIKWINRQAIAQGIGALTSAAESTEGVADSAMNASIIFQQIIDQFNTMVENLNQTLLQAFGNDLASMIGKVGEGLAWLIKAMSDLGMTMNVWWAGAKSVFVNVGKVAGQAWDTILAGFQYMIGGIALGFGKLIDWLPFGDMGDDIVDWANTTIDAANESWNNALNPEFLDIEREMSNAAEDWIGKQERVTQAAAQSQRQLTENERELSEIRDRMGVILQETENWSRQLSMAGESAQTTAKLIELIGPNIAVAGQDLNAMNWGNVNESIRAGITLLRVAGETAIQDANRQIDLIEKARDERLAGVSDEEAMARIREGAEQELNKAIEERNFLVQRNLEAYQAFDAAFDQAVAKQKAQLEIADAQRSLYQRQLDISKALYGTPALGVQSMLRVTKQMQIEKDLLKDQLESIKAIMAQMEAREVSASKMQGYRKRVLELEEKIAAKTAEQLSMVKELRDGYLDAVQAQAFASGEFEKIIISQEKNLGMALDKGLVKANYLLGQVGEAANEARAMPYRFGAEGFGDMRGMDNQRFGAKQVKQRMEVAIKNVSDPSMQAAIEESMNTVTGIQNEAARMYVQASETQVDAIDDQIQATDGLTGAIYSAVDAFANKAAMGGVTAGGITGGVSEGIIAGEAAREQSQFNARRQRRMIGVTDRAGQAVDVAKAATKEENKKNEKKKGRGGELPRLEVRDAIAQSGMKGAEQQKSGLKLNEQGFYTENVGRYRKHLSPSDADASKVARKHMIDVREKNAKIYDKSQAQEGRKGGAHATGGHELTHDAGTRSSKKTKGGGSGSGMGTQGDKIIEAAKLMKKAAENLIFIADDIDVLASEDRGVQYRTHPAQSGGNAMNTG